MLQLSAFEFIARIIPEGFIFIFATYAFSNIKINMKRYVISSFLLSSSIFIVRMFPIDYGVHTILNIIIQTLIVVFINKIEVIQAIKSAIITAICLFIFETANMFILSIIFKDKIEQVILNKMLKTIYGLPSLICFISIVLYYYLRKRNTFKYV